MSNNEEDEDLEEIESGVPARTLTKELIGKIPNRKVIIQDKKLKIVIPSKQQEDDDETDILIEPIKKLIKAKPNQQDEPIVPDNDDDNVIEKPKAKRTQKQIDAFKKVRDKKMENARLREQERKLLLEQQQKELEEKIIKKAVSIKKKQIKKQAVLEEISDDETSIEVIKEIKRKLPTPKQAPTQPKFNIKFV